MDPFVDLAESCSPLHIQVVFIIKSLSSTWEPKIMNVLLNLSC